MTTALHSGPGYILAKLGIVQYVMQWLTFYCEVNIEKTKSGDTFCSSELVAVVLREGWQV